MRRTIGPFLATISSQQEDRVLTTRLRHGRRNRDHDFDGYYVHADGTRCLIGAIAGGSGREASIYNVYSTGVWEAFDRLCVRFGDARIAAAIRNRILANRARRVLADVQEPVTA